MTVFRKCSGRRPLLSLESTARASEKIALGQEFDQFSPLPPESHAVVRFGGEREETMEMLTLGYRLTPRWIRKKRPPAASQMSNHASPSEEGSKMSSRHPLPR